MADGDAYRYATNQITQYAKDKGVEMIVGPEARGFIVGCPVAYELGIGFAPVRKKESSLVKQLRLATVLNTVLIFYKFIKMRLNQGKKF